MTISLDDRGLPAGYPFMAEWEITPREARALLAGDAAAVLLDVRRPDEWAEARIEGAVLVPLHELGSHLNELSEKIEGPIVVHCRSGKRSLQATEFLRRAGFEDVRSMAGGIELWFADPKLGAATPSR